MALIEYERVEKMTWDELMLSLKKRAIRKEKEVVSSDEEEDDHATGPSRYYSRSLDGPLPQSRYSCVYANRSGVPWKVEINALGIKCYLRSSQEEEEAARLADRALHYLVGSKARLNFPHETPGALEPDLAAKIDAKRQAVEAERGHQAGSTPAAAVGPSVKVRAKSGDKRKKSISSEEED